MPTVFLKGNKAQFNSESMFYRNALTQEQLKRHYCGFARKTASFEFSFKFKNEGETPITIVDIQTSCGCTVAMSDKCNYLPNENGEIKGVFSVGDRKGVQNKTIVLLTNDLGQSQIQLDLNLKIAQAVESSSNVLFWKMGKPFKAKEIMYALIGSRFLNLIVFQTSNRVSEYLCNMPIFPIGKNQKIRE